ncbi:MAG TPA: hypothetical protein VJB06_01070 [archaeon]|nr:hypothetical protein [archaeon]
MAIGTRILESQTSISGLCSLCGTVAKPAYTCNICGAIVCLSCFHHNIGACKKCVKLRFNKVKPPSIPRMK